MTKLTLKDMELIAYWMNCYEHVGDDKKLDERMNKLTEKVWKVIREMRKQK